MEADTLQIKQLEKRIRTRFNKAGKEYNLLEDGDNIVVGLSGGKDSLMLLKLLAEQSRIYKPRISVVAVHIKMSNIPYQSDIKFLNDYCNELGGTNNSRDKFRRIYRHAQVALLSMFVEQTKNALHHSARERMQQNSIGTQHGRFP